MSEPAVRTFLRQFAPESQRGSVISGVARGERSSNQRIFRGWILHRLLHARTHNLLRRWQFVEQSVDRLVRARRGKAGRKRQQHYNNTEGIFLKHKDGIEN